LTGRNEKLSVRVQIFENVRTNSRAIWRKLLRIWADQAILQSAHGKPDRLLELSRLMRCTKLDIRQNRWRRKKSVPRRYGVYTGSRRARCMPLPLKSTKLCRARFMFIHPVSICEGLKISKLTNFSHLFSKLENENKIILRYWLL